MRNDCHLAAKCALSRMFKAAVQLIQVKEPSGKHSRVYELEVQETVFSSERRT